MMTSPPPPPPKENKMVYTYSLTSKENMKVFTFEGKSIRKRLLCGDEGQWQNLGWQIPPCRLPPPPPPQHRHCLFIIMNIYMYSTTAVNFVCDHPLIRAVSFVGSDQAGNYIHERASRNGKRVQCNMGAKNHGVIMPDANKENTLNQVGN